MVPAGAGDTILGITLFDQRETDENGELLKFRPHKAAELEAVISGQAMPVVRKGLFAISGVQTGNGLVGSVTAGTKLYAGVSGAFTSFVSGSAIGLALGSTDANNATIVFFDANNQ